MKKATYILCILLIFIFSGCKKNQRHLVVSKIQDTAKLATTETIIDKVVIGQKEKRIVGLVKIGSAEFVAYSQAIVKTGIDLKKINREDILIEGNIIELKLPAVEVLDFAYPFEKYVIDTVLSDNDIFNKIDVIDQEVFFRQAEIDVRKNLKFMGIVEQTQDNTRKLLVSMLKNLGYDEVYISFAESEELIQEVVVENNE